NRRAAQVLLIGSADILADAEGISGHAPTPLRCEQREALRVEPGRSSWLPTPGLNGPLQRGQSTAAAGLEAMRCLNLAARAALLGRVQAIVFAPLNKHALRQAGVARPRSAVSGLNPHAGDGGSIGREEIEVIAPAVQALQAQGLDARGPYSPDTVFIAARRGDFDAVVSMYHDQGQIAMKLMGFERGVTLHGGLPVPVATSASGSAYDIAGQGVAGIEGLQAAFDLCVAMAAPRAADGY
ncbi:MAG: PdxA family protein, partial [Aquabacterium sp.]